MKKASIVIGLGYGDEGKGLTTDYLAHNGGDVAVARFSGGANAGHTVELLDGTRHVFSHFGSGSFVGAHTILAEDFVVNPVLFWQEAEQLIEKVDKIPHVYIDPNCMVTTPYDVFLNQAVESTRSDSKAQHGSTGVGLGETVERQSRGFGLRVMDFYDDHDEVQHRLEQIRDEYFWERLEELGCADINTDILENAVENFIGFMHDMLHSVTVVNTEDAIGAFEHVIFEGSQGLLLDENSRDFPHVTRANTGLKNVAKYLKPEHEINVHYVTRTYLSRHGAGPLDNEIFGEVEYEEDKTNFTNTWQGHLRYAPLDYVRIAEEVKADTKHLDGLEFTKTAVITWASASDPKLLGVIDGVLKAVGTGSVLRAYGKVRECVL